MTAKVGTGAKVGRSHPPQGSVNSTGRCHQQRCTSVQRCRCVRHRCELIPGQNTVGFHTEMVPATSSKALPLASALNAVGPEQPAHRWHPHHEALQQLIHTHLIGRVLCCVGQGGNTVQVNNRIIIGALHRDREGFSATSQPHR